jgi:hypothetical protein
MKEVFRFEEIVIDYRDKTKLDYKDVRDEAKKVIATQVRKLFGGP